MSINKNQSPIFIVGSPRSGTTLIASMISAHKRIDCGPETHFFCHLNKKWEKYILNKKLWPKGAIDYLNNLKNYIWSLKHSNKNVYDVFGISINEIEEFLTNRKPSIQAVLESLTVLHAKKNNKERWAEKTPNHLLHIRKIKKYYPESKIIHIIRDFRDSALSISKVPWGHPSPWINMCNLSDTFYRISRFLHYDDKNITKILYENLVYDLEKTLSYICNFLNEDFDPQMLEWNKAATRLYGDNEWWKKKVSSSLDPSRCYVWKRKLDKDTYLFLTLAGYTMLKTYGYDVHGVNVKKTIIVYPCELEFLERNQEKIIKLYREGVKLVFCFSLESVRSALEIENPDGILLLSRFNIAQQYPFYSSLERIIFVAKFFSFISSLKNRRIPCSFVQNNNILQQGYCDKLTNMLYSLVKESRGSYVFRVAKLFKE